MEYAVPGDFNCLDIFMRSGYQKYTNFSFNLNLT